MNIVLIAAIIVTIYKITDGYKKGMVKEIISLVSMVVLCLVAGLIAAAAQNYVRGQIGGVIIAVFLLCCIGIVHHLLGVIFFSAKMIVKLPVIHFADKLLGIVFGVFEVVIVLWTLDTFIMMSEAGTLSGIIIGYMADNSVLTWIYQHNWLAYEIEKLLGNTQQITAMNFLLK